jgi:hypothetical protein
VDQPRNQAQVNIVMGVRIVDECRSNAIPLYRNESLAEPSLVDARVPEPTQLYGLTVLAFLLHTPTRFIRRCVQCGTAWPCDHLRLAFRLREAF